MSSPVAPHGGALVDRFIHADDVDARWRRARALATPTLDARELADLVERDVKGLYPKAIAGKISHFTGVSDPYEPPASPDVVVRTDREGVGDGVTRILQALIDRELIAAAVGEAVS